MKINWYPGHMKVANEKLLLLAKSANIILNIIDARAVIASNNQELINKFRKSIKIITIVNKCDLISKSSLEKLKQENSSWMYISAKWVNSKKKILKILQKTECRDFYKKCLVVGITNTGKSTIINLLANKHKLGVENKPGVTKIIKKIHIVDNIYLFDTPGIMFKNIVNNNTGYKLVMINSIRKELCDLDYCLNFGYYYLIEHNKYFLSQIIFPNNILDEKNISFIDYMKIVNEKICNKKNINVSLVYLYQKIINANNIIWET